MNIRPEQRCEADINYKTIRPGSTRIVYDFEGRRQDLGPDTPEETAIVEVSMNCTRCPIKDLVFQAEGRPPFGAVNEARRQAANVIETNCQKYPPIREAGAKRPDSNFHPKL